MPKVVMKKSGRWADPEPHIPQQELEAGQEYDVSPRLADILVETGSAEYAKVQKPASEAPARADKRRADKGRA